MGFFSDFADFLQDPLGKQEKRDELAAQAAARENIKRALEMWDTRLGEYDEMESPWNEGTIRSTTTQQRDILGGSAAEELDQARRLAGASGLGRGGALGNRERMIREEMARRGASTAQQIRGTAIRENSAWDQQMADLRGQATAAKSSILSGASVDPYSTSGRVTAGTTGASKGLIRQPEPTVAWR